jgi:hypothetical protein
MVECLWSVYPLLQVIREGVPSGFALPRSALHDSRRIINYSCTLPRFFLGSWCEAHERRSTYEPINALLFYLHLSGPVI